LKQKGFKFMNTNGYKVKAIALNQLIGKEARGYRNLHKGHFIVQDYQRGRGRRVVGHTQEILLSDCRFKINQTGL
jgi:hypothetical protein